MSEWYVDGFYFSKDLADRVAKGLVDEEAAERSLVRRHANGTYSVRYLARYAFADWHDERPPICEDWVVVGGYTGTRRGAPGPRCEECGRPLRSSLSVNAGHGPTCSRRVLARMK